MKKELDQYYKHIKELKIVDGVISLLQWDQETNMPVKNTNWRAEQIGHLSLDYHRRSTSSEYVDLVGQLFDSREYLEEIDKRSIEISKKQLDKLLKLPDNFIEEFSKIKSKAHKAWIDAKKNEDVSLFFPLLQTIVEMTKQYATYIDDTKPIYDVLLDEYEEGMTTQELDKIFYNLRGDLIEILEELNQRKSPFKSNPFTKEDYNDLELENFIVGIFKKIGFDLKRGAVGRVHHPFQTSLSSNDIRLNMSYYHKDILATITGAIHELGHGLYEQNIDESLHHTPLSLGTSLGVHESQSRLLENMIGRSEEFWKFFLPSLLRTLKVKRQIRVEDITDYLNQVYPTPIRIESDEITYNIHIIIRYELELEMLADDFDINNLEDLWNSKYAEYLGVVPERPSSGVLQDVHWSMGAIGYFPTYTLGNIIAGQLWENFTQTNKNFSLKLEHGDFHQYIDWFKNKIWAKGSFYNSKELIKNVLREELDSKSFTGYLRKKYLKN